MSDPSARPPSPPSPITQLLQSIGMTRHDLARHSDQMREYLTGAGAGADIEAGPVDLTPLAFSREQADAQTPRPSSTRTRALSCTNPVVDTSVRPPTTPAPSTPVKAEPFDLPVPVRPADSMEMVMERKSRQAKREKRARKERERNAPLPPSPSPSHSTFSMDAFIGTRPNRRASLSESSAGAFSERARSISNHGYHDLPDASQQAPSAMGLSLPYQAYLASETYDPTTFGASRAQPSLSRSSSLQFRAPAPGRSQSTSGVRLSVRTQQEQPDPVKAEPDATTPLRYYRENTFPAPQNSLSRQNSSNSIPVTPRRPRQFPSSQLPPSSPLPMSSPMCTPTRSLVNMVSSPGPMGPPPEEDEYDDLPFKLPPGPYSTIKPELSYAALIGRAVLSSPGHRLTLQEIYEWITIVFPYYRRDEQTWMNSVRHVLSTTACFRKVPRERGEGKTQWAIWDRDLRCFDNGGFDKRFCSDIPQKRVPVQSKKRPAPADEPTAVAGSSGAGASGSGGRRKRIKKDVPPPVQAHPATMHATMHSQPMMAYPMPMPAHALPTHPHGAPLFPAMQGHPYHQSYYQACIPGRLPVEVIFPPLPPSAALNQRRMSATPAHQAAPTAPASRNSVAATPVATPTLRSAAPAIAPATRPSTSEAPATSTSKPQYSSPEAAPSPPSSSQVPELLSDAQSSSSPEMPHSEVHTLEEVHESPRAAIVDLEEFVSFSSPPAPEESLGGTRREEISIKSAKQSAPDSPTLTPWRVKKGKTVAIPATSIFPSVHLNRLGTPPPSGRPTTPPPKPSSAKLNLSPQRTPLSHRGLHMSPSPSLAHYKSNLDPPAVYGGAAPGADGPSGDVENFRTPSRKRQGGTAGSAQGAFPPVTPKRLFPSAHSDGASGGLAPHGFGLFGSSPFRTPGIFDPHDPGMLLDEELSRLGASHYHGMGLQDSPGIGGLLGSRGLLYESPSAPSPGRFSRFW